MTINSNITTSWDGLTGEEVQNAIKDQFSTIIENTNKSVTNIVFSQAYDTDGNEIAGQVSYVITYSDNSTTPGTFKLTATSSYTAQLDKFEAANSYVSPGNGVTINYGFSIFDGEGTQVSGKYAQLQFTVTNGTYTKTYDAFKTPYASYKSASRTGSYTIPTLKEGLNTISVSISFLDSDRSVGEGIVKDGVSSSIIVASYSLTLGVTSSRELNEIVEDPINDVITLTCSLKNGSGANITSAYGTPHYVTYNSSGNSINSYSTNSITETLNTLNGGTSSTNQYVFYVQAYIKPDDDTTIYSNVVKYQYLGGDLSSSTSTRFAYKIANYSNYTNNVIRTAANYQIEDQYSTVEFPVYAFINSTKTFTYSVNDETITSIELSASSTPQLISLTKDTNGDYIPWSYQITAQDKNVIVLSDGSIPLSFNITTNNIGSDMTIPGNYVIRLTANGKNGKDTTWGVDSEGNSLTSFYNFDWSGNGWSNDALIVNNNARAVINVTPCYKTIYSSTSSTTVLGRSASFRFKTINENTEEELITCYSSNTDGFKIYPQKAVIYRGTSTIETTFTTEDSIKEVTFVWYNTSYGSVSIIYVNGTSQAVLTSGTSSSNSAKINITANETSLYLYNVETYERALNFNEVQALYKLHDSNNIVDYINENAIFDSAVELGNNGQNVTIESLPVGSTYMLIKAHPKGQSKFWEYINNLPATKKINGEDVETKSWRLLAGNTYLITKVEDEAEADSFNFFADKITISGQGTSSMSYPIKNFRIYFNKKITPKEDSINSDGFVVLGCQEEGFGDCYSEKSDGKYGITSMFISGSKVIDTDYTGSGETSQDKVYQLTATAIPANVFCLKADYAESSGIHNTGFARLANDIVEGSTAITSGESNKLPINKISDTTSDYKYDYTCRQSIDGRAVYLFFQDNEGNVIYHGKYNLNNEKASPEVFGFQPYPIKDGSYSKFNSYIGYTSDKIKDPNTSDETLKNNPDKGSCEGKGSKSYFDMDVVKNEASVLKGLFGVTNDDYDKGHMIYKDSSGAIHTNPTECWEFSTNDASSIEHRSLLGDYLSQIGAFTFPYTTEDGTNISGYPYSSNSTYANLNPFKETLKDSSDLAWINTEQAWEPRFPDDDNINDFYKGGGTPYLLRSVYKWVHKHNVYCWSSDASKLEHAAIFAQELNKYFNVNYLIKYYMLTKLFINADQRVKNCMLAFYCDPNVTSNTDSDTPTGHMRGFYIFYDNDTILGVTNTGSLNNPWNAEETADVFQGIDNNNVCYHGLWGNLEYCYDLYINSKTDNTYIKNIGSLMETAYRELRSKATDTLINGYLSNSLPDAASNIDAEVKYFYPKTISPNATNWNSGNISQYQGNRKYHREWLLGKRTKWFDAQYGGGSISDYKLTFKLEAASGTFTSGNIKLYPEFDKWKFYWQEGDKGTLIPTALLNKNEKGVLTCTKTINSNVYAIKGLYGANKIDLSDWYGTQAGNYMSTINNSTSYHALPYLKEFIMGNSLSTNIFYVHEEQLKSLFVLNNESLMPNLEKLTIQNITGANNGYFDLNLSKFTKLKELNTTGTLTSITLPSGSMLETLVLEKPTSLTLEDKTNLNSLTINYPTSITSIVANHCSDTIYQWSLNYLLNNYTTKTNLKVTLTLGNNVDKDTVSGTTVGLIIKVISLLQIGTLSPDNVKMSGLGYCSSITPEQSGTIYNYYGSDLVISSTSSENYELNLDDGNVLYEGSQLKVYPTLKSDDVNYFITKISGDDTLFNKIAVNSESSPYLCILNCDTIGDNTTRTCSIKVTGVYNGVEIDSDTIIVQSNAITSFTLSIPEATNNIITGESLVKINLESTCTKQHLLTSDYIAQGNISITSSKGTIDCSTYDLATEGFTYTMTAENEEDVIIVSLFRIEQKLPVYYDVQVCIIDNGAVTQDGLLWLNDIFDGLYGYFSSSSKIMRSDLSNITIDTNGSTISFYGTLNTVSLTGKSITAVENRTCDFSILSYFKPATTFRIPGTLQWSNLNIPEKVENVVWTSTVANYNGYQTVKFPTTTNKVIVATTFDTLSPELTFDISNTELTKIYNTGITDITKMSNLNKIFSLSFLTVGNSVSNTTTKNHTLFTYNNKITQIGYYSEDSSTTLSLPNAMFNISDNENGMDGQYNPMYSLGSPTNTSQLNIGYIASYQMNSSVFTNWTTLGDYVTGLYYTFYKNSGCPETLSFTKLQYVGDYTFNKVTSLKTLYLGSTIQKFGASVLDSFAGTIATDASNSTLNLLKVTEVNDFAFNALKNTITFNLGNSDNKVTLSYIGDKAFFADEGSDGNIVPYTINIYTDSKITNLGTLSPFGTDGRNTIYLYTSNDEVIEQFSDYKSVANIYVNGSNTKLS